MPKRNDENFLDYKKRMIDSVSGSYCAAKFLNATIWLGHGQTASCHHPPSHQIDVEEIQHNPSAIHNTRHKKKTRAQMLAGDRPQECEYCWKVEDSIPDAVSDRTYKTARFTDRDIANTVSADPNSDSILRTLEVSFDRTCNFACSYCNPSFSTTWVKDIRKNGPYTGITTDKRNHFTHDAPYAQPFSNGQENPYIKAFWEWWPELSTTLEEIRITGGEPLMSVDVWKLFQWFEQNPDSKMSFAINSNLGGKEDLIKRLIEKSKFINDLQIYTSNESYGAQAEYIRDGMDYAYWRDNIARLATFGNVKQLHMMMTINALCLSSITEFMEDMMDLKRAYGRNWGVMSLNILRYPTFQSPLVLPLEYRTKIAAKMQAWLDKTRAADERCKHDGMPLLGEYEVNNVVRLIGYLTMVEEAVAGAASRDKLEEDFKTFYQQYDARRQKDFCATFPDLADWFNAIGQEKATEEESIDDWFDRVTADE